MWLERRLCYENNRSCKRNAFQVCVAKKESYANSANQRLSHRTGEFQATGQPAMLRDMDAAYEPEARKASIASRASDLTVPCESSACRSTPRPPTSEGARNNSAVVMKCFSRMVALRHLSLHVALVEGCPVGRRFLSPHCGRRPACSVLDGSEASSNIPRPPWWGLDAACCQLLVVFTCIIWAGC